MRTALHHIRVIVAELSAAEIQAESIREDDSLLDLGMDSLRMIDLTIELEERLLVKEFPIQQWADTEAQRADARFTVGSLAQAFELLMVPSGQ